MEKSYYEILSVDPTASAEDIRKAFKKQSLIFEGYQRYAEHYTKLCEAYEVLNDLKKRRLYDLLGNSGIQVKESSSLIDDLERIGESETYVFYDNAHKVINAFICVPSEEEPGKHQQKSCGNETVSVGFGHDIEVEVPITLKQAFDGCRIKKTVVQQTFGIQGYVINRVDQNFSFDIPPGCPPNHCIVFKQAGDRGPDIQPGDVLFKVKIIPDPVFRVCGLDLVTEEIISPLIAEKGCVVKVTNFHGEECFFPLRKVIQHNHRIVIEGQGMPYHLDVERRGDLIVEIKVQDTDNESTVTSTS